MQVSEIYTTAPSADHSEIELETYALLEEYIAEFGFSKDEFVRKAIMEKISRDKISSMIDDMIKL